MKGIIMNKLRLATIAETETATYATLWNHYLSFRMKYNEGIYQCSIEELEAVEEDFLKVCKGAYNFLYEQAGDLLRNEIPGITWDNLTNDFILSAIAHRCTFFMGDGNNPEHTAEVFRRKYNKPSAQVMQLRHDLFIAE